MWEAEGWRCPEEGVLPGSLSHENCGIAGTYGASRLGNKSAWSGLMGRDVQPMQIHSPLKEFCCQGNGGMGFGLGRGKTFGGSGYF